MSLLLQAAVAEDFIVDDIRVNGLRRISAGTVFNYLPITVGDRVDEKRTQEAVRALFKTGFFKDVRLDREGDVLVVDVIERESIADITFKGNKAIKTEELLKGLGDIGFAKGEVFNESKLDKVTQELRRQYYSNGKYGVKIDSKITPLDDNSLTVAFTIVEGERYSFGDISVETVANSVGFSSLGSFTAAFTERVGVSPGEFKQKNRAALRSCQLNASFN